VKPILRCAAALAAIVTGAAAWAAAGDPPSPSMDLDAVKPKTATSSAATTPATTVGTIGSGFGMTQKAASPGEATSGTPAGGGAIGIKPAMSKGVIGAGLPGAKPAQSAADAGSTDTGNDLVIKMPSNAKK
jgi:hypothetical protein